MISRGTRRSPGLMLALARGGACRSLALRLPSRGLEREITLLLRREMMTNVYHPRWLWLHSDGKKLPVLSFVINRRHPLCASELNETDAVKILSTAKGVLGSSADYLFDTVSSLRELGIRDRSVERLSRRVLGVIRL